MRMFQIHDKSELQRLALGDRRDPEVPRPEDPLLDILRVMLGMFAVFVAVWLTILLLTSADNRGR